MSNAKENKMGTMKVPALLATMALPMMISMVVQALYNIVDSIFVARLNEDALAAVSLVFPVQNLMIAIAIGTGVGINALLSRNLGERRFEDANMAARNGLFLSFVSSLAFALIGTLSAHTFFAMQTNNETIIRYGTQYMMIISILSMGIFVQITLERLLQSTGKTIYNMVTQGLGAIINIILDPILIFGLGPFPRMEVAGAAAATVAGQLIAVCISLYFNLAKNREINLNMKGFRPNKEVIVNIYRVGIPSIFVQAIGSIMVFGMNKILLLFSTTAATVFGVYFKLQSFIFMPVFGLTNALVPIIAYNYGARNKQRILSALKLSCAFAMAIMAVGMLVFQLFPEMLLARFNASEQMMEIGLPALRTISTAFIFAGASIVCSASFQAMGKGMYSLITSAARQLLVILPVAYLLAKLFGLHMVWWSLPIAEVVSLTMSLLFLRRIYRQKIKPL